MPLLRGYPVNISYECSKRIIKQMENNVCNIRIGNGETTGFFCKIPFPDLNNMLPVLITVNFIFGNELLYNDHQTILLELKNKSHIKLDLNDRIKYSNREFKTAIIEIKENDGIKDFLELDDFILKDILDIENLNETFINTTLYTIQYGEGGLSTSYGILDKIDEFVQYEYYHKCSTKNGASGSPMLNLKNKVLGMHTQGDSRNRFNIGTFLNHPIKEFININAKQNNEKLLKEFNKKYNLDINDFNITKLNLSRKFAGNELLKDLSKFKFNELKELYLYDNDISDLKDLQKINFEKLEVLDLCNNNISDIKVFEKINLDNLKQLLLINNNISDINVLGKINLNKLEILDLRKNKIDLQKNAKTIGYLKSKVKEFNI